MKKLFLSLAVLMIASLACTVQLTATSPTEIPVTPIVVTVVSSQTPASATLAPSTAMPTQVPATSIAATSVPPTLPPPVNDGTIVTYRPLTVIIPQSIANGASGSYFPRVDGEDAAWWQKTPGHLQVSLGDYDIQQGKTHQPQIYIYPAQAYAELVPPAFESIHRLNNYLYAPNNVPSLDQLPGIPFFNAQILFASHIQLVSFQNGSGIRYVTEYAQYPASVNNTDLFYNFIGITRDGAHYIVAIFPLSSPTLAETSDAGAPLPAGGIPYPYMSDPNANMEAYYIAMTDLLNVQPPHSFSPTLSDLDRLIQSMQVEE